MLRLGRYTSISCPATPIGPILLRVSSAEAGLTRDYSKL